MVTGAASGIGHATAAMFHEMGETVYGLDIAPSVPDGVTYVECNVADRASVEAAIEVCSGAGRIDVLANVAGVVQFGRFETITDAEWDRVHDDRPQGTVHGDAGGAALDPGREGHDRQRLVGRRPGPAALHDRLLGGQGRAHDADPRAGARAVARRASGSTPSAPAPSTPRSSRRWPSRLTDDLDPRVADRLMMMLSGTIAPGDIAAAIRYLASPEAGFVTGAVLAVDGGMG